MGENVERRFDGLAKSLARGHTRKGALKVGVGALGAAVAAALPARARADGNPEQGNDACAHFCTSVFPPGPDRGACISAAAHGEGICFECGPAAPPNHPPLCGTVCCNAGEVCCNGACTSTACTGGHVFNPATCRCECPTGTTECSGVCVNLQTNPQNCGTCGHVCPTGASCVNGQCVCPTGTEVCGNACVTSCTPPKVLNPTTCQCECPAGTTPCGTTCCASGEVCNNGTCGPPPHPECAAATCATFVPCSSTNPDCVCTQVCTNGVVSGGQCVPGSTPCAGLVTCGSNCECPAGQYCAPNTCCGVPVCVPLALAERCPTTSAPTAAAFTPFTPFGGGPTIGGV